MFTPPSLWRSAYKDVRYSLSANILQIEDLRKEIKELQALIDYLKDLLEHHEKILALIKDETNALAEKYGDDRRTYIVADEIEEINIEDMIKEEDVVILD